MLAQDNQPPWAKPAHCHYPELEAKDFSGFDYALWKL